MDCGTAAARVLEVLGSNDLLPFEVVAVRQLRRQCRYNYHRIPGNLPPPLEFVENIVERVYNSLKLAAGENFGEL